MNRPLNQQQPGIISSPMKQQQTQPQMNSSPDYFIQQQQQQQQRNLGGGVVSPTSNGGGISNPLSGSSNRGSWGGLPTQQQTAQAQQSNFNQFFNKNNSSNNNNIYSSSNSLRKSGSTSLNGSNSGLNLNSSNNNIPSNGINTPSKTKYSKDELLNLYDPSLAVPDTLVSHTHILSEDVQTPINFNYDSSLSKSRDRSRMTSSNNMLNQRRSKDLSGHNSDRKPKWANSSSSHSWRREDDRKVWYYLDPNNVTQGPFSNNEMDQWYKAGYFPATLLIRKADGPFVEFKKLLSTQYPFNSSNSSSSNSTNSSSNDFKVLEKEDTSSHSTSGENDSHEDEVEEEEDLNSSLTHQQQQQQQPSSGSVGVNDDDDEQNIIKRLGKDLLKPQTLENQDKSSPTSSAFASPSSSVGISSSTEQHQSISSQQDPLVERTSSPQYSIQNQLQQQKQQQQQQQHNLWMNQQQIQQQQQHDFVRQQQQQVQQQQQTTAKPDNDYSKYMALIQLQQHYQIVQQNLALLHNHIQQLQSQSQQLQSHQPQSPQTQIQLQQIQQLLNNQNQHYYMLQQKAIQFQIEMFQLQQNLPQQGFPQQPSYAPPIAQMMKFQQQIQQQQQVQQQQPIDQQNLMDQQQVQQQPIKQEQTEQTIIQEVTQTTTTTTVVEQQQQHETVESESENEQILWGKSESTQTITTQEKPSLQIRTEVITEPQQQQQQEPEKEVEQKQEQQEIENISNNLESNVVISNPWATTSSVEQTPQIQQQPAPKKKSLAEIQMEELMEQKKKDAEDAKQKLLDSKNQPNVMKWAGGNVAPTWSVETIKPMSLKEIQEEEKISREKKEAESVSATASVVSPVSFDYTIADSSRKKISFSDVMKEQSKEKKYDSPVNTSTSTNSSSSSSSKPTFNPSSPWSVDESRKPSITTNNNSNSNSNKAYTSVQVKSNEDSFWEAPSNTTSSTKTAPSLSVRSNTTSTPSSNTNEFPTLNIMAVKPATIVKATPNPVLNIKKSGSASSSSAPRPDFIKWCHNELKPLTNNDVATLTELFCSLKTESEIRECIKECLGYTSEVNNFINEYLLARSDEPGLTFESSSPVITIPMKNKAKSTQSTVSKSSKKKK